MPNRTNKFDLNSMMSKLQVKDERQITVYLRAVYKDLCIDGKLRTEIVSQYLKMPYFICDRIFKRYNREGPIIQEKDFYDFMKSIYLYGYGNIVESIFKLFAPSDSQITPRQAKTIFRYLVGVGNFIRFENACSLVDELFSGQKALSLLDFIISTESTSSGMFLTLLDYFFERKPFSDATLKYLSKTIQIPEGTTVKSKFSSKTDLCPMFIICPSDITLSSLSHDFKNRLMLSKQNEQEVNCCIYERILTVEDGISDDELDGSFDDYSENVNVNLVPKSLNLKNSFIHKKCSSTKSSNFETDQSTLADELASFNSTESYKINNINNFNAEKAKGTVRLQWSRDKFDSNSNDGSTCPSEGSLKNLYNENKLNDLNNKKNSDSILFETNILVFNNRRNKLKQYWMVVLENDILYFKKSSKSKLKSFHNLTETFIINEKPIEDVIKNKNKLFSFKLKMRENIMTLYFKSYKECIETINVFKSALGQRNIDDFYTFTDLRRGQLNNSKILKAKSKLSKEEVIVKVLIKGIECKNQYILNEMDINAHCFHNNVISLYDIFEDAERVYLVLEYMKQDSLTRFLINNGSDVSHSQLVDIVRQISFGIKYLHNIGVVHRDIKPDNIGISVIDGRITAKIMDFGLSLIHVDNEPLSEACGSIYFCAPEVLIKQYNYKVDIWSLGILMCYVFYGKIPNICGNDMKETQTMKKSSYDFLSDCKEDCYKILISGCLNKNYKLRLSIDEIIEYLSVFEYDLV
jgi:hypothetical protein